MKTYIKPATSVININIEDGILRTSDPALDPDSSFGFGSLSAKQRTTLEDDE